MKRLNIFIFYLVLFTSLLSFADERIKMSYENGVYTMPCEVNGLRMKFVFDTGASSVSISLTEAIFMLKNGYIDDKDFEDGYALTRIANGDVEENMIINLKEVKVGSKKIKNVKAVVSNSINAPLLLGQSVIRRLGTWMMDGDYLVLKKSKDNSYDKPQNEKTTTQKETKEEKAENYYKQALAYKKDKDYKNAFDYYKKAADLGHTGAQVGLGVLYEDGHGVSKDLKQAFKWYKKAAEKGNLYGQYDLALCYRYGKGVDINYNDAFKWFSKSAEQGYYYAQNSLGNCYHNGQGTAKDYAKAFYWYQKSAEQGYSFAQYNLGDCYCDGIGVKKDLNAAATWYLKAANQGHNKAQYKIAECYFYGNGVLKDYSQAFLWYQKSAEKDNYQAQNKLGDCYFNGYGTAKDHSKAFPWYLKAADKGNNKDAQYSLGNCYYYGYSVTKDLNTAFFWYKKSAEQNNSNAQFQLGYCYNYGYGTPKDYTQAFYWYQKAANLNNAAAQNNLGVCYETGNGTEKDLEKCAYWYQKSAEQGSSVAQNNLGLCYEYGRGVFSNSEQAVLWYRKSAENGYANAQYNLGRCYENGYGVIQDIPEALKWYQKAADQGNEDAKKALANITKIYSQEANLNPFQNISIENVRFVENIENNCIDADEHSKLIFDIRNTGNDNVYNISPVITVSGTKQIYLSPTSIVSELAPGKAVRYQTEMVATNKLESGVADFTISFSDGDKLYTGIAFQIATRGKQNNEKANNEIESKDADKDKNIDNAETHTGNYDRIGTKNLDTNTVTNENVTFYTAQVSNRISLRETPDSKGKVLATLSKGDYVFVSSRDKGEKYRFVNYIDKDIYGYIPNSYLLNYKKVEEDENGKFQVESINYTSKTAEVTLTNLANVTATITFGLLKYKVGPNQSKTIKELKPGRYKCTVSSPGVIPYVGNLKAEAGYTYTWSFYIRSK